MRAPALLLLSSLALFGCDKAAGTGPAEVKYDRDTCAACSMAISEPTFATQVRGPEQAPKKFDDLGCAMKWLERQSFKDDPAVAIWVTDGKGGWVDARTARFVKGAATPMGYGWAPGTADGAVDFAAMRTALNTERKAP